MPQKKITAVAERGTEVLAAGHRGTVQNRSATMVLIHIGAPGSTDWEAAFELRPGESLTVAEIAAHEIVTARTDNGPAAVVAYEIP